MRGPLTLLRRIAALSVPAILVLSPPASAQVELSARSAIRVCADGDMLPFSNEAEEGFENKLAQMLGDELDVPVLYTWWPQTVGFVRNTLGARRCDLVMGTASGEELMQNTNPYYRSVYALVVREGSPYDGPRLADPAMRQARIGVVAQTPPADLLRFYRHGNIAPYQLNIDTRAHNPARQAVEDVAAGTVDAAIIWGPIAGYHAARQQVPLKVVPLVDEQAPVRLAFYISMGIRIGEPEWKHRLNAFISERQQDINRLLLAYHVPLLGGDGRLIEAAALAPAAPAGYRMEDYRAPVPAGLPGATTLDTEALRALAADEDVVLIDVLPSPPRPEGRDGDAAWMPPRHDSLPGSVWLPNVGYGALSEGQADYFRSHLEQLTGGDRERALVFYCQPDCWMSWNAAKRALEWGYRRIYWYPEGTEGWRSAGLPLEPVAPADGVPR